MATFLQQFRLLMAGPPSTVQTRCSTLLLLLHCHPLLLRLLFGQNLFGFAFLLCLQSGEILTDKFVTFPSLRHSFWGESCGGSSTSWPDGRFTVSWQVFLFHIWAAVNPFADGLIFSVSAILVIFLSLNVNKVTVFHSTFYLIASAKKF